jgi:hypothetical protein
LDPLAAHVICGANADAAITTIITRIGPRISFPR